MVWVVILELGSKQKEYNITQSFSKMEFFSNSKQISARDSRADGLAATDCILN